tara:strand:- start:142057 stop:143094 length:1038 start_codon:yes stop_codon:yes gene_type:complete
VTSNYVAYISTDTKKKDDSGHSCCNEQLADQESRIDKFLLEKNSNTGKAVLLKTFIELGDNKRSRHPWPELEDAIQYAIENKAYLLIPDIKNLTNNASFAGLIESYLSSHSNDPSFTPDIYCCDKPYIKKENFKAIVTHSEQQRKMHGELIKEGLTRSNCKSGNPNAINIINKVNKPKIDNAIVFALALAPIINYYQLQGLSQRKLVAQLNEDGFTAPEGGHWVLSQLQKVLKRIKVNESALSLEQQIETLKTKNLNNKDISQRFNELDIPAPIGNSWSAELITQLEERLQQIHNIIEFHEFVINLSPILEKYHIDDLNEDVFANELQLANINIPTSFYSGDSTN